MCVCDDCVAHASACDGVGDAVDNMIMMLLFVVSVHVADVVVAYIRTIYVK